MSTALDPVGPAPETRSVKFITLLFGASAAPLFWLGQLMLGYGFTAYVCYPGDHPTAITFGPALGGTLIVFDVIAVLAAIAGGGVSFWCWSQVQRRAGSFSISAGRVRFLALWGIFSSLWFFCAIVFNVIGSLTVPPCLT